ncbi:MAG: hypothetical protein IPM29_15040 [Planctomycetes bacterium]|nr:hypothetical protein [Planctomycetota bacterium]
MREFGFALGRANEEGAAGPASFEFEFPGQDGPHPGLGNELEQRPGDGRAAEGNVVETERLGGLLRHYVRVA